MRTATVKVKVQKYFCAHFIESLSLMHTVLLLIN